MNDRYMHLLLFMILSSVIVLMGALYSEPDDAKALRGLPRRLFVFVVGCAVLAGILLLAESTVASVV